MDPETKMTICHPAHCLFAAVEGELALAPGVRTSHTGLEAIFMRIIFPLRKCCLAGLQDALERGILILNFK